MFIRLIKMLKYKVINIVNDLWSMNGYPFKIVYLSFHPQIPTQSEEDLEIFSGILCNSS
jgi:hypothetical protein